MHNALFAKVHGYHMVSRQALGTTLHQHCSRASLMVFPERDFIVVLVVPGFSEAFIRRETMDKCLSCDWIKKKVLFRLLGTRDADCIISNSGLTRKKENVV